MWKKAPWNKKYRKYGFLRCIKCHKYICDERQMYSDNPLLCEYCFKEGKK